MIQDSDSGNAVGDAGPNIRQVRIMKAQGKNRLKAQGKNRLNLNEVVLAR
jgi:hypothetical protein